MEESARAIASAIVNAVEHLTVIYSNTQDGDEAGAGNWIRVPDEWFYGKKFRECLRLHRGGIMLQIQADAESSDWPEVVERCRDAYANHDRLGVWGPDIDYTPWNTEIVKTRDLDENLVLVVQVDGIVWSVSEMLLARLGELDYDCNNLGWGIDWMVATCARCNGLLVTRDVSITVRHPPATGYSRDLATGQMQTFLSQMTAQEADQYALLSSFVSQKAAVQQCMPAVTNETLATGDTGRLMDWPSQRADALRERLRALLQKEAIPYSFVSGIPSAIFRYFPEDLDEELAAWTPDPFRFVAASGIGAGGMPDVVIVTAHSNDAHLRLWEIREECGSDPVIVVWLWDNHTGYLNNKATVLAADLIIPCHSDAVDYLFNPAAVVSSHVPLCCAQWSRAEAVGLFARYGLRERQSRLLVNYVEYAYASERNEVIRKIGEKIPEADVLLMPSHDRSRYFGSSADRRFDEWTRYKTTIILPVTQDLSTRFFDALLAGLIPIVPTSITDLDRICPAGALDALGVIRIDSCDIGVIHAATREALARFDAMGSEGVLARHRFVLEHHMLVNRVTAMLHTVYRHAAGELDVEFGAGAFGAALYQVAGNPSLQTCSPTNIGEP